MEGSEFIAKAQECLKQIEPLREEKLAIGSSKVKGWRTEVEHLLKQGGKNTSKLLQSFQSLRFGASASDPTSNSGIKFQAYQAEMDASEKILKNAIQTVQIFGIT